MPRITGGRFLWDETAGILRLPVLLGQQSGWWSQSIRKHLGETYDPVRGQLLTSAPWQAIGLWFACWHMLDLIDHFPRLVPEFSGEDFSHGVLNDLFGDATSPFESGSGYSATAVTPAFTILHYLGSLDLVKQYCDVDDIARQFVSLQDKRNGYFQPALGWEPGFNADAFQLQSLVGINMLEATFDKQYLTGVNHAALRSHLTARLRALTGKTQAHCDQWLFNLRNVIASLHLLHRRFVTLPGSEATAIAGSIMHCFGLKAYWEQFVRAQCEKGLDDLIGAFSNVRKPPVKVFPGRVSQNLGMALWSAYTVLSLLRRSSAIALLENAIHDDRQMAEFSSNFLSGDPYYLLGTAFLLRNIPLMSLDTTHQPWFRGERALSVRVLNESARPVKRAIFDVGACCESPKGLLGAATNDEQGMRLVNLQCEIRSEDSAPLRAGEMRIIKVGLRTVGRVGDYPQLFLIPRIKCNYGGRVFRLTREYFRQPMILQMLPNRSTVLRIIEETRRKAATPQDLSRLLREELKDNFDVELSPAESERLYYKFFPDAVARWLQQFELSDRSLMQKLVRHITFYSADDMRQLFTRALLRPAFKNKAQQAIFIGVGEHQGKSGPHLVLYVKHAYKRVFPEARKDEVKFRFPTELPESISNNGATPFHVDCVVFVDDFFGSGTTTCKFLAKFRRNEREVYRWIWRQDKFFLAISGFDNGQNEIVKRFPELKDRFIVHRLLRNSDRAFSPKNSIFGSEDERKRAEKTCRAIGEEILLERARQENLTDRERKDMALGWDNGQALIRFQHNIPNNTLPIIWEYKGQYKGKRWMPLYERHD